MKAIMLCIKILLHKQFYLHYGKHFSCNEKKILLKSVLMALYTVCIKRKYFGLCVGLREAILYFCEPDRFTFAYEKAKKLYDILNINYHNPGYYNSKGLCTTDAFLHYWWPKKDIESRLKALDILEQAIIND